MSLVDWSRIETLQGLLRACYGHLTLSGYSYPESFGSVAIDPFHRWCGFSPCWPIGGRSVPPRQLQIRSPDHLESLWLLVDFHTVARWHLWWWPEWDLDLGNSFGPIMFSRVVVGIVVITSPLIASHILMMWAVDCIRSYHGPQLGLISWGMWYLLISILSWFYFVWKFYERKGLISVNPGCPKRFLSCCLAYRTKGLTLADARCLSLNRKPMMDLKRGWSINRWPYKFVWIYGTELGCQCLWWRVC